MATLGNMKARGEGIILYCQGNVGVRWCNHSHIPSMDQLIQYFGVDCDLTENRAAILARFVCEHCGSRDATLQLISPKTNDAFNGGVGDSLHGASADYVSIEEATHRHHAFMADFRSHGFKTNEEVNAESRLKLEAQEKAKKSGAFFIGPPSPWAHRKKGRWL